VDLAKGQTSGLEHAMKILKGIRGIAQVEFTATDVLRHHLVKDILLAYAQKDKKK
jgi:phosphate starvation-inducible PhoH-like protein